MTIAELKPAASPDAAALVEQLAGYVQDGSLQWLVVCFKLRGTEPRVMHKGNGTGESVLEMVGAMEAGKTALLWDSMERP